MGTLRATLSRARRLARRSKGVVKHALFRGLPAPMVNALVRFKLPSSAQVEVTTACNLRCPLCTTHDTPRGARHLAHDQVARVVQGCGRRLKLISFHLLGEPLLNRGLFDFVRTCEQAGVRTTFSTNGMLLHRHIDEILDSGLEYISVAIDGANAEDYARYRLGGDFDTVVRNIRMLVEARRARGSAFPQIQVQMVMFSYNEDNEAEARAFLDGLGADVVSLKRPAYVARPTEAAQAFWAQVDHENAERRFARPTQRPERLYRNQPMCPQLERATVLSDGSVVACCLDARGETAFGNLHDSTFEAIWHGEEHRRVLERFQRRELSTCAYCTLGFQEPELAAQAG